MTTTPETKTSAPTSKETKAPKPVAIKPLKAVNRIVYGDNQSAEPGDLFRPASNDERKFLVETGEYPVAVEPNKAELALFRELGNDVDDADEFDA